MFVDRCAKLGLLEYNPESNILRDFSLHVRKVLVKEVVTFLLEGNNAQKTLLSPAHVTWAMETVGQGFALPIEEEDSIVKVITLYRVWCLDGKRPAPFEENPQHFTRELLGHFSLLFSPRESAREMVDKHANLCSRVLDIYLQFGRQAGDSLNVETWETFLKLLLGVCDNILRADLDKSQETLQKKLCPQLLKVLFELWLLSRTKNPDLWAALFQRVVGWTQHMSLVLTWKVTAVALTKRVFAILYGPSEGTDTVIMKIDESAQNLVLEDTYVLYAWHKMLNIIGNPNVTVNHPAIFLAFMNGVEMLVNLYVKLGHTNKLPQLLAPNGNTILHIFGEWMFDAVHKDRSGFDEGTALAMKILCNLITSKNKTNWETTYIARFYSCLNQSLAKDGRVLLAAITSSTSIFNHELPGLRTLVPSFASAIHRVISRKIKNVDNVMPAEHVRRSSLIILSTILCLPNHFGSLEFKLRHTDKSSSFDIKRYSDLKQVFITTIIEGIGTETFPPNIETLLHLLFTWMCEDIKNTSELAKQILPVIVRKIHTEWTTEVNRTALRTLSHISFIYSKFEKGYEQANFILLALCKLIENHMPHVITDRLKEELVCIAFECISDWLMLGGEVQWVLNYKETRKELLKTIVLGLTGSMPIRRAASITDDDSKSSSASASSSSKDVRDKKDEKDKKKRLADKKAAPVEKRSSDYTPPPPHPERIREASQSTLAVLLNDTGNFPTACGAHSVSSMITEENLINENLEQALAIDGLEIPATEGKQFMRYFITDDRVIICVIDRPYEERGPGVTIVVRDRTGKYAWDTHLSFVPISDPPITPNYDSRLYNTPISTGPYHSQAQPIDPESLMDIYSFLDNFDTKEAIRTVKAQVETEQRYLESKQYKLADAVAISPPVPANPYVGDCKVQQSRILLSHFGYLSLQNRGRLYPCVMNASFYNDLRRLDDINERECTPISVVLIRKGQATDEEYLGNIGGSVDYQEFVSSLGWGIDIRRHNGFKGSLEGKRAGHVAPYWASYSTEIIFQVSTLIPNTDSHPDHSHKRRILFGSLNYVVVAWVEDIDNFQPASIWSKSKTNSVIIAVHPLPCGLYLIRLFSKSEISSIGPLVDGIVLSKSILGTMVRETALFVDRKERTSQDVYMTQKQIRQQVIEDVFAKFKRETTLEQFYSALFTPLNEDQVGPVGRQGSDSPRKKVKRSALPPPSTPTPPIPVGQAPQAPHGGSSSSSSSSSSMMVPPSPGGSLSKSGSRGAGFGTVRPSQATPPTAESESPSSRAKGGWLTMGSRSSREDGSATKIGVHHRRGGDEPAPSSPSPGRSPAGAAPPPPDPSKKKKKKTDDA